MTKVLPASPERVWRALTDGAELAAWFWPQRLGPAVTADPRPGGLLAIRAGTAELAVGGRYLEIAAPHRLVHSWQWDGDDAVSTVTITLSPRGEDTELLLTHEHLAPDALADHAQGWHDCLDRLTPHLT